LQVTGEDETKIFVSVTPTDAIHFGRYAVTASNVIDSTSVVLELAENGNASSSHLTPNSFASEYDEFVRSDGDEDDDGDMANDENEEDMLEEEYKNLTRADATFTRGKATSL
jgi:hypothetical protein